MFLDDGRLPIDNNAVEREIRPIVVGRKNWMFAGSDEGGQRAAVVYSLIGSCVLAGVEPEAWFRDVLVKISGGWPNHRIGELLPKRVAKAPDQDQADTGATS